MTFEEACGSKSMKKCGKANISHELINIFSIFLVLWSGKFTVGYIEYRRFPIILYFSLGFPSNIHRKQKDFFFQFFVKDRTLGVTGAKRGSYERNVARTLLMRIVITCHSKIKILLVL